MDKFEEQNFPAFGLKNQGGLAAQLKLTANQMSDFGRRNERSDLIFDLIDSQGNGKFEGDIQLSWDGLRIMLKYQEVGTDLKVYIYNKKGERLWRLFVDAGYVTGGKYPKRESKTDGSADSEVQLTYGHNKIFSKEYREIMVDVCKACRAASGESEERVADYFTYENAIKRLPAQAQNRAKHVIGEQLNSWDRDNPKKDGTKRSLSDRIGDDVSARTLREWGE